MTEKEKMLAGMVYSAVDKELLVELNATKEAIFDYNRLRPSQSAERLRMWWPWAIRAGWLSI